MAGKFGKCDFRQLVDFEKNIKKLTDSQVDDFMKSCAKELAARLLAKVIKRTPVGIYPASSGKKGGTLRRGWTAGQNQNVVAYAQSLTINQYGGTYVIEIVNPVDYASYVEFGHRTRDHKGWIEGRFMMTISEQEIDSTAPGILEKKLNVLLGECFK